LFYTDGDRTGRGRETRPTPRLRLGRQEFPVAGKQPRRGVENRRFLKSVSA